MCYVCWGKMGEPKIVNENTKKLAEMIERLYETEPCGGHCHIFTDDFNCEDDIIKFCLELAREENDELGIGICEFALKMSEAERASALAIWEKFF